MMGQNPCTIAGVDAEIASLNAASAIDCLWGTASAKRQRSALNQIVSMSSFSSDCLRSYRCNHLTF